MLSVIDRAQIVTIVFLSFQLLPFVEKILLKILGFIGAALIFTGFFAILPNVASAQSACVAGGPLSADNAYLGPGDAITKAARRGAAVVGTREFKAGCKFEVICVSSDNSKEAFLNAKLRCKTVREALIANLSDERKSKAKRDSITLIAKRPNDGFRPASVHISYK